jgi:hypothetical protein
MGWLYFYIEYFDANMNAVKKKSKKANLSLWQTVEPNMIVRY